MQNNNPLLEMAEQARKNYEQALRSSLKIQDEMMQRWTQLQTPTPVTQQCQKHLAQFTNLATSALPLAQQQLKETMELVQKSSQTRVQLMQKAVEAAQTVSLADSQAKWMEFCQLSLGAAQSDAQAMVQFNTRAIGAWVQLAQQTGQ